MKNEIYFPEIYPNCAPEGTFGATLNPNRTPVQNTIYNNYCSNYDIIPDNSSYREGEREREKEKDKGNKGGEAEGEGEGEGGSEISLNEKNDYDNETKNNGDQISVISSCDYIPPKSVADGNYDSSDDSNDTEMGESSNDNADSENDGKTEIYASDDEEEKKENDSFLLSSSPNKKSSKVKQSNEESKIEEELSRCSNQNNENRMVRKCNTEEYPFTADQALFVSEILYTLRPLVLAWGVHFIKERRRKSYMEKNVNNVTKTNPNGVENGETSGNNNMENDMNMENTLYSTMEDFFPLLLSLVSIDNCHTIHSSIFGCHCLL
jgi:hypothetical protein